MAELTSLTGTAKWPENKRRAFKYRWRRLTSNGRIKRKFAGDHDDPCINALSIRQELTPYPRRGSIGTDQHISFCARPVLEMRNDSAVRHFLERLKGLAEGDDIFETLGQDLAQCDTADRPRGVCGGLLGTREIDREQSAQLMIKKRGGRADLGRGRDVLLEVRLR